jgi:hypothetical protein
LRKCSCFSRSNASGERGESGESGESAESDTRDPVVTSPLLHRNKIDVTGKKQGEGVKGIFKISLIRSRHSAEVILSLTSSFRGINPRNGSGNRKNERSLGF